LVEYGYDIPDYQLTGGPDWTVTDRFDIVAKATDGLKPSRDDLNLMLQGLLRDRFALQLRKATEAGSVYLLVLAKQDRKLGEHLHRAPVDCTSDLTPLNVRDDTAQCGLQYGRGKITAHGRPLSLLIALLASTLKQTVVDNTGLSGAFDFQLEWARDPTPEVPGPSLFTAVQEQLGLKMDSGRGAVQKFVIDHIEKPTSN